MSFLCSRLLDIQQQIQLMSYYILYTNINRFIPHSVFRRELTTSPCLITNINDKPPCPIIQFLFNLNFAFLSANEVAKVWFATVPSTIYSQCNEQVTLSSLHKPSQMSGTVHYSHYYQNLYTMCYMASYSACTQLVSSGILICKKISNQTRHDLGSL